jgi:hypothetical protein
VVFSVFFSVFSCAKQAGIELFQARQNQILISLDSIGAHQPASFFHPGGSILPAKIASKPSILQTARNLNWRYRHV